MCSSAASSALTASRSAVANDRLSDSGIRSASSAARRAPSRQPVGRSRHDFVASRCDGAPRTVDRRRPAAAGTARGGPPLPARARRRRRRMLRGAPTRRGRCPLLAAIIIIFWNTVKLGDAVRGWADRSAARRRTRVSSRSCSAAKPTGVAVSVSGVARTRMRSRTATGLCRREGWTKMARDMRPVWIINLSRAPRRPPSGLQRLQSRSANAGNTRCRRNLLGAARVDGGGGP